MNGVHSCDCMRERKFYLLCQLCFFFLIFVAFTYHIDYIAGSSLRGISHLPLSSKARVDNHPAGRACLRQLAELRGGVRDFPSCNNGVVHRLVDFIDSAAAVDIRVFPRNGLLLGIVRHHGFLPFENPVDLDLGVMYSDLGNMRSVNFQFESVRGEGIYKLIMDTKLPKWNVV